MADDQKSTSGEVPDLMQEFIAQLRGAAERLEGLTGLDGSLPSVSALPSLPPWLAPGASSATQLETVTTSVAAYVRSKARCRPGWRPAPLRRRNWRRSPPALPRSDAASRRFRPS